MLLSLGGKGCVHFAGENIVMREKEDFCYVIFKTIFMYLHNSISPCFQENSRFPERWGKCKLVFSLHLFTKNHVCINELGFIHLRPNGSVCILVSILDNLSF